MQKPMTAQPHLYLFIFLMWGAALAYFHRPLWSLLEIAHTPFSWTATLFFILFTAVAWLYGFYNVGVVVFAMVYRATQRHATPPPASLPSSPPAVAILYTTCNDFVESSAASCVVQDYPNFTVYILDDSSDPEFQKRVDRFAAQHPDRVRVVRRGSRRGYKAGNLNDGLTHAATTEPLFALVDADEVFPPDFLLRVVPRLLADEHCGFVQANHHFNPLRANALGAVLGKGIDIHWRWYQPLRNRYGFVMLLGHGAVIRRVCWEQIGGFPEVVSEDLAFALRIRECGWRGHFAEDIVCYEDFPETIRAFRVRHMKWIRGTCELLTKEIWPRIWSPKVPLVEKLDVLFPTMNLPLSLLFFLFVLDTNLVFPQLFGTAEPLTIALASVEFVLPVWRLDPAFTAVTGPGFFFITLLTLFSPILCFLVELAPRPRELFRFISQSTTVYGALGPLSAIGVAFYLVTGKAEFHVTADQTSGARQKYQNPGLGGRKRFTWGLRRLFSGSHPDHWMIQAFEVSCGLLLGLACLQMLQISFLGMAFAYGLLPVLHHVSWDQPLIRCLVYLPFLFLLTGLGLGTLALVGIQPVFFGFGFHF